MWILVPKRGETIENEEGYILDIQKDLITINAKEDAGAFYAVQTLRQLLPEGFEGDDQNMVKTSVVTVQAALGLFMSREN